jgi:hypothetical protein
MIFQREYINVGQEVDARIVKGAGDRHICRSRSNGGRSLQQSDLNAAQDTEAE